MHTLETLPFDNAFARLPANFYTRLSPEPLAAPYLVGVSPAAASLIGLAPDQLARPEFPEVFAGNRLMPGSEPLAAVYSGHQFGVWAGQLGDGRAHLLGEVAGPATGWEIQLKGAGQTPYSRFADGRAVLRSSIREFLCSEAMAALGIPTTRALCVVGSHAPVRRESIETAAVCTRLAPSFIRFGSFEHWAAQGKGEALRQLADYVIDRFRPECREADNPYDALLRDVARRTAELIAAWQAVGFMHGVMNTDNMSILGLTLDYGPFGFMDAFDAGHICNHSDDRGRYSYKAQPQIGHWNLYALGHALSTLVGEPAAVQAAIEESYAPAFEQRFMDLFRAKLGLAQALPGDEDFIGETFDLLQRHHPDFTLFFRQLGHLPARVDDTDRPGTDAPVRDLFIDRDAADAWLTLWRARLGAEGRPDNKRQDAMMAINPKFVLRNWIAESAIRAARAGDFSEVAAVQDCLSRPFDEQPGNAHFAAPPPDWAHDLEVSCSS
ncbi:protein adenylyltransferase SelO [Zoogloea sp.]|uniref:protein adenylyltransferase SelO n=1 Tax=Zoogloea sp. TaxID=49181 RepID=UPI002637DAA0|nr:YdiU family protein [Zoogloea sp.]MDD3353311.1 YdiU family protein [Zoogloea sp.]